MADCRKGSNSCGRQQAGANIRRPPSNGARVSEDFMPANVILPNESSVELKWSNLPALAHRARYENELSKKGNCRGAIEGRTSDFPSVKINGLESIPCAPAETNVTIYVCLPDGRPHPFFYCKTAGRDAPASCQSSQLKDGTHVLRQVVKASNGYTCEMRHVGIVRLRQGQDLTNGEGVNRSTTPSQANFFRLCVMTELASADGRQLSVISEPIKCISSTQSVLKPKISQIVKTDELSETGRAEIFIFGKDFTPNTKFRVFQKLPDGRVWQEMIEEESCTWFCAHHCCAKVRLPLLPSEFGRKGTAVGVRLEGVPHSARRPADSVAPNWAEASTLQYPAEAPRATCSLLEPKSQPVNVAMPLGSVKRPAEDQVIVDERQMMGFVSGKPKSPRSSPLPTPPSSPSFHIELTTVSPTPAYPPANFQPSTVQPLSFQPNITHLDNFASPLPVQLTSNNYSSLSNTTPFLKTMSTLASDMWTMPSTQSTAPPPQPPGIVTIFDDLSMSSSPTSSSDLSSSCGSPYQDVFAPSEEDIWPLLDFWDVNDTTAFSNQVVATLPQ